MHSDPRGFPAAPNLSHPGSWDLGKISQNQTFTRTLEIYNAGNALLQIKDVRPSCGCTITDISTNEIYPCDSASLEVSFNSGGFEGKIKKKIYISSNDPQQPLVIFKIMAEVAEKRKKSSH